MNSHSKPFEAQDGPFEAQDGPFEAQDRPFEAQGRQISPTVLGPGLLYCQKQRTLRNFDDLFDEGLEDIQRDTAVLNGHFVDQQ